MTPPPQGPRRDENTYAPRAVLAGLAVVLSLVLGGLVLVYALRDSSRTQDCVMQGRTNCFPVDPPPAAN